MATKVVGVMGLGPGSKVVGVPTPFIKTSAINYATQGATVSNSPSLPSSASVAIAYMAAIYPDDGSGSATISIIYEGSTVASKTISSSSDWYNFKCGVVFALKTSYTVTFKINLSSYSGSKVYYTYVLAGV